MSTTEEVSNIRVYLEGIFCSSVGTDGDDYLQIYGSLGAQGTIAATIWEKDRDNAVNVGQGLTFPIGTFKVLPLKPNESLSLYGHLIEKDLVSVSDDDMGMGFPPIKIPFAEIPLNETRYYLKFQQDNQKVQAIFKVKRNT